MWQWFARVQGPAGQHRSLLTSGVSLSLSLFLCSLSFCLTVCPLYSPHPPSPHTCYKVKLLSNIIIIIFIIIIIIQKITPFLHKSPVLATLFTP